jgi:hypothetical protein
MYAVDSFNHIINLLTCNEFAYSLQIAIAPSKEHHLLYDIVLVGSYINHL